MPESFIVIRMGLGSAQICTNIETIERIVKRLNEWNREELLNHRVPTLNWQKAGPELRAGDPNPNRCHDHPETHKHWLLVC